MNIKNQMFLLINIPLMIILSGLNKVLGNKTLIGIILFTLIIMLKYFLTLISRKNNISNINYKIATKKRLLISFAIIFISLKSLMLYKILNKYYFFNIDNIIEYVITLCYVYIIFYFIILYLIGYKIYYNHIDDL